MLDLNQFTGFTTGPWTADNTSVLCGCPHDPLIVCNTESCNVLHIGNNPDGSENEQPHANAKLIAAAPELLTECKRLRADLDAAMAFIRDDSKSQRRRNAILMAMDYLYPKPPTAPQPAPPDRQ